MRSKRRLMAEINVVPYIDVMLVLLIIFMITAPLLTQGVQVQLPQADAKPIEQTRHPPVILSLDAQSKIYLSYEDRTENMQPKALVKKLSQILSQNAAISVLIQADQRIEYGQVIQLMVMAQKAGANQIGLLTDTEP